MHLDEKYNLTSFLKEKKLNKFWAEKVKKVQVSPGVKQDRKLFNLHPSPRYLSSNNTFLHKSIQKYSKVLKIAQSGPK